MAFRDAHTETEKALIDILCQRMNAGTDFLNGVLSYLDTDDERQDMIDEILNGNVKTPSDALLFALEIYEDRVA